MDKKILKKILIVFSIILLIGIGIWGYKKIKNKINDSKVVENENDIKAIDSLISVGTTRTVKSGTITYNFDYKMYLKEKGTILIKCGKNDTNVSVYDIIFNLYASKTENKQTTNLGKIMTSWIVRDFTDCKVVNAKNDNITAFVTASNAPIAQVSGNYFLVGFKSNGFIYTKVFDITTGELLFDVPTNNLEVFNKFSIDNNGNSNNQIKFSSSKQNLTIKNNNKSATFSNKYAILNNSLYYLDTDYTVEKAANGYVKLNVHKVNFENNVVNDINLSTSTDITSDKVYAEVKLNGE